MNNITRASEAGKLLKDRLMSTDSDSGFEKYDNLCAKNANSQVTSFSNIFCISKLFNTNI